GPGGIPFDVFRKPTKNRQDDSNYPDSSFNMTHSQRKTPLHLCCQFTCKPCKNHRVLFHRFRTGSILDSFKICGDYLVNNLLTILISNMAKMATMRSAANRRKGENKRRLPKNRRLSETPL